MEQIGRRLVIHWGKQTVAIGKLLICPETLRLDHLAPGALSEVYLVDGELLYKQIGYSHCPPVGRTVNDYMINQNAWVTTDEFTEKLKNKGH